MKAKKADSKRPSSTTSTQGETEGHKPATSKESDHPAAKTSSPAGNHEVDASKTSANRGTQTTNAKKIPPKPDTKKSAPIDQTLNPKKTNVAT